MMIRTHGSRLARCLRGGVGVLAAVLLAGCGDDGGLGGAGGNANPDSGGGADVPVAGTGEVGGEVSGGGADVRGAVDSPPSGGPGLRLIAGGLGGPGDFDGVGAAARFRSPAGITTDGAGHLFVTDVVRNVIRKIDLATGLVTTLAGTPGQAGSDDGLGSAARFNCPDGITSDGAGHLFVADSCNSTIRKVVIATGAVTTFAGVPGGSVDDGVAGPFSFPVGITLDGAGNLYVTDMHAVRKVVIATGTVTTLAGSPSDSGSVDGIGTAARFNTPVGITHDGAGNLFVADLWNSTIRRIVIARAEVTTLAGFPGKTGGADGTGAAARFGDPAGIAFDGAGHLFVVELGGFTPFGSTIRKVDIAIGEVTTLAGLAGKSGSADGTGAAARFDNPRGIASDGDGDLFIADTDNFAIRKVVIADASVSTLAGGPASLGSEDGVGAAARFSAPRAMASDGGGNVFVSEFGSFAIRKVVIATGEVSTLAGAVNDHGSDDGVGATARFDEIDALATDNAGNLFVADRGNHNIRRIVIGTGEVSTVAGAAGQASSRDGVGAAALFCVPEGLATDDVGNLFVADQWNHTIRRIVIATRAVTTFAGSPGRGGQS